MVTEQKATVLTVTYGRTDMLELQSEALAKFMPVAYHHIITDSLDSPEINSVCSKYRIGRYVCRQCAGINPSDSHACALNFMFANGIVVKENMPLILLDSDIFPIKNIDLHTNYELVSWKQTRGTTDYCWPGFVIINHDNADELRWNTGEFLGSRCDTGGATSEWIKKYDPKLLWCGSVRDEDDFWLLDDTWYHFVNGSNWRGDNNREHVDRYADFSQRIKSRL